MNNVTRQTSDGQVHPARKHQHQPEYHKESAEKNQHPPQRAHGNRVLDWTHPSAGIAGTDHVVLLLFIRYHSTVDSPAEKDEGKLPKVGLALFMAAAFIAAVRLASVENLSATTKVIFT